MWVFMCVCVCVYRYIHVCIRNMYVCMFIHCVATQVGLASKQTGEFNMSVVVYTLPVKEWSVQLEQTTSTVELFPFFFMCACLHIM